MPVEGLRVRCPSRVAVHLGALSHRVRRRLPQAVRARRALPSDALPRRKQLLHDTVRVRPDAARRLRRTLRVHVPVPACARVAEPHGRPHVHRGALHRRPAPARCA